MYATLELITSVSKPKCRSSVSRSPQLVAYSATDQWSYRARDSQRAKFQSSCRAPRQGERLGEERKVEQVSRCRFQRQTSRMTLRRSALRRKARRRVANASGRLSSNRSLGGRRDSVGGVFTGMPSRKQCTMIYSHVKI